MTFSERMTRYQRGLVVRLLARGGRQAQNIHLLADALGDMGQDVGIDRMVALAEWLCEAGLARIVVQVPPVTVRLTRRGRRLARGRIEVRGVTLSP